MLGPIWSFLGRRKKYWLLPMVLVLLLFGALVFAAHGSDAGPFRYSF